MNAKELDTAEAIVNNHIAIILHHTKSYNLPQAQKHAKLEVNAIINYHNSLFEKGFKNIYQSLLSPTKHFQLVIEPNILLCFIGHLLYNV